MELLRTREELFEQHFSLAMYWASKYRRKTYRIIEFDDLKQIGLMSLWHCTEKFNPSRGVKFSTFFSKAIIFAYHRAINWQLNRRFTIEKSAEYCQQKNKEQLSDYFSDHLTTLQRKLVSDKISGYTNCEIKERNQEFKTVSLRCEITRTFDKIRETNPL